ncbi:HTH_Tnp_Tc3_2 domain-containing protein [Trichonephila clavipes]|nr:HTH_Tnp_Tc3_2 domain-containing protein [Trichonephila clavipes]
MDRIDTSIRRCWQEWMNNGRFQLYASSGRTGASTDPDDRLIVRSAVIASDLSLLTIGRATRTQVSTMTVHRRLIHRNLRSYRSLRHMPLMPTYCPATLQWCLARLGYNHDDCGGIVFRNEFHVQLCPEDHRRRIWRHTWQYGDLAFTIPRHTCH